MNPTIVQITFDVSISLSDFKQAMGPAAEPIAAVDGLQWKIWSMDEARHEFCGIYLFANGAAADAYLNGPIIANLKEAPFVSNLDMKSFAVIECLTALTHGPINASLVTA